MKGFTLIDVLIGTALTLIIFLGIFAGFQLATKVIASNQLKTIALAIANREIEEIRNLSYGAIVNNTKNVIERGQDFKIETIVNYIDDPSYGTSQDYKRVEVKVSWRDKEISLITDVSP